MVLIGIVKRLTPNNYGKRRMSLLQSYILMIRERRKVHADPLWPMRGSQDNPVITAGPKGLRDRPM